MILKKLGFYQKPNVKTRHDLSAYSIDEQGQVWSNNRNTYVTKYGRRIRQGEGADGVATLRDAEGKKVSIVRKKLVRAFIQDNTFSF